MIIGYSFLPGDTGDHKIFCATGACRGSWRLLYFTTDRHGQSILVKFTGKITWDKLCIDRAFFCQINRFCGIAGNLYDSPLVIDLPGRLKIGKAVRLFVVFAAGDKNGRKKERDRQCRYLSHVSVLKPDNLRQDNVAPYWRMKRRCGRYLLAGLKLYDYGRALCPVFTSIRMTEKRIHHQHSLVFHIVPADQGRPLAWPAGAGIVFPVIQLIKGERKRDRLICLLSL